MSTIGFDEPDGSPCTFSTLNYPTSNLPLYQVTPVAAATEKAVAAAPADLPAAAVVEEVVPIRSNKDKQQGMSI